MAIAGSWSPRFLIALPVTIVVAALVTGCASSSVTTRTARACNVEASSVAAQASHGDLVVVGRIVTMHDPPIAEAMLIENGTVAVIGTRNAVMAVACEGVAVVDIGENVAYPGFIDAHAHWIGDRGYYGLNSAEEAMDAALSRGWTSISEQWVNPERLGELIALAAEEALPLRVDAYLALNYGDEFFGEWYTEHARGPIGDHLRIQGLKIHLDDGSGATINWEPDDLTTTIGQAIEAGWQLSVHTVSTRAMDLVLDAFETALGPSGPNPLHHRIEHALQVTDDQLVRMVAMDLVPVVQLDGVAADWVQWAGESLPGDVEWFGRWRDFVNAGLHVAASSDTPWFFPDLVLTDDVGRPVDEIAGGMDGRGKRNAETPDWMLDQLLTAEQGLRGLTVEAAYAIDDEVRRGHLVPGTLGDVTILSGDVQDATADEIRAMRVIATIVGGVVVYCADTEICGID